MEKGWGVRKETNSWTLNICNTFQICHFSSTRLNNPLQPDQSATFMEIIISTPVVIFRYLQLQSHFLYYLGIFWDKLLKTSNSTGTVQRFLLLLDNYYWQLVSTEIHLAQATGK